VSRWTHADDFETWKVDEEVDVSMTIATEVYFHYPAGSSPLRPMDVKKAQERRSVTPKPKGLVFNTLTNGLEELDEARI